MFPVLGIELIGVSEREFFNIEPNMTRLESWDRTPVCKVDLRDKPAKANDETLSKMYVRY
jgi:hypothetical protein